MSGVVPSTWSFVKRHKGKFLLLGAGVGGYIYLNKILTRFQKNWEKSASKVFVAEVRKKEAHFENTIRTCNSTCASMAPKIIDILDQLLDAIPILEDLKKNPKDTGLWKDLSIVILTRAVSEVYCLSLFVCYLRVQLLVIAGYLYVDSCTSSSTSSLLNGSAFGSASSSSSLPAINQSIQMKYLSLLHAFYDEGIKEIVATVRTAVTETLNDSDKPVNLTDKFSNKRLKSLFDEIRSRMAWFLKSKEEKMENYDEGCFSRFLIHADKIDQNDNVSDANGVLLSPKEVDALKNLMIETQDLLETEDFKQVLFSSIDVGFTSLEDSMFACFVPSMNESSDSQSAFSNPNSVEIKMAKLLPKIRNILLERSRSLDKANLIRHLICLDVLNCYSANVYEAFCDPQIQTHSKPSTSQSS